MGWPKTDLKIGRRFDRVAVMMTLTKTPANRTKMAQLEAALGEMLVEVLKRGFHGTAGVEWSVQDGTIQKIRRTVERIEQ